MACDWDDVMVRWGDLPAFTKPYNPYPHQVEGFIQSAWSNTVVIMPTGTGKTLTAAMLMDLYSTPDSFILFVVNNVALVDQQTKYLRGVCKSPWSKVSPSQGGLNVGVTVGTAGALLGLMEQLPFDKLVLVVFDEAHHATGDHPYVQILNLIRDYCPVYPRIIGLTASWLHGELRDVEAKRHSLQSVLGATIFAPDVGEAFQTKATFKKVNYPDERVEPVTAQKTASWIINATEPLHPELASAFAAQANKAVHVETNLGIAGLSTFTHALCDIVGCMLHAKAGHTTEEGVRETALEAVEQLPCARQLLDAEGEAAVWGPPSAKVQVLLDLMAVRKGLTLVFVEQVCCVFPMARILSHHLQEPALHVSGSATMPKEVRDMNVSAFRNGRARVLVATAALEEGLDVPDCDCVVRFDAFSNVKSHVQGSGRARKVGSEVFYFDNTPEEEDKRTAAMYGAAPDPHGPDAQQDDVKPGAGEGHQWGDEETIWDVKDNKSFRGQKCAGCGAHLRITSRAYGQGRKKKERLFAVEGPYVCPSQHGEADGRLALGSNGY